MTRDHYDSVLKWCGPHTYKPGMTVFSTDTPAIVLHDRVNQLDKILAKYCGVKGTPCEYAAKAIDQYWNPGAMNEGGIGPPHWVVEPSCSPDLMAEVWRAAVGAFKNHALIEEQSCRV